MSKPYTKRLLWVSCVVVLMVGVFIGGGILGYVARPASAAEEPAEFGVFWEAWDVVVEHFVDRERIDFKAMTYGAIEGMLNALGDQGHTTFLAPDALKQHDSSLEGSFEGIGAYVAVEEEQVTIVAPIAGSPAEAAGVLAGDVVVAVNGESVVELTLAQVISLIRGPAGTTVTLTVMRAGVADPLDIEVVRGRIEVDSVVWSQIPGTELAYLHISQFTADTSRELQATLTQINRTRVDGHPLQGIVLDLRNNPGGYLHEAIRTASQFLPGGDVILLEQNARGEIDTYKSRGRGLARQIPMIVLINEGTASAGEIVAGALQENRRARLVGATTFGTGTVLNQFNLSDGSAVLLGVTNWLTPNGRLIKDRGITPDVLVEQETSARLIDAWQLAKMSSRDVLNVKDRQFKEALELLNDVVRAGSRAGLPEHELLNLQ